MPEQLYPKPKKEDKRERDIAGRRWRVDYDLVYDYGGSGPWKGYYWFSFQARAAAWWNVNVLSWGGSAVLVDQQKDHV